MIKKISLILAVILLLCAVVGCGTKPGKDDDPNGKDAPQTVLFNADNTAYRIVVPQDASKNVADISAELQAAVKETTGRKPDRVYDNTEKYPEEECEVLIGLTSRDASKKALEEIAEGEYIVRFEGKKLIVLAANDALLEMAIKDLIAHLNAENTSLTVAKELSLKENKADQLITFEADGTQALVRIIVSAGLNTDTQSKIYDIANALKEQLDAKFLTVAPENTTLDPWGADKLEIFVGDLEREESLNTLASMTFSDGYRIDVQGKKICLVATTESNMQKALTVFLEDIEQAVKGTLKGKLCLSSDYSREYHFETPEEKVLSYIKTTVGEADTMNKHRILVISDTHYCSTRTWDGMSTSERMAQLKKHLKEEYEKDPYELIVFAGDYSLDYWGWNEKGSYLARGVIDTTNFINAICKDLPCPYVMLPGNHEQYSNEKWKEITGFDRNFSLVVGDYLFVCWDSYATNLDPDTHSDGTYSGMNVEFVKAEMEKYPDKKVIGFTHWFSESGASDEAKAILNDPRFICVFCGHNHISTWVSTSGGKAVLYTGNYSQLTGGAAYYGFRDLYMTDKGVYSTYIIPENTYTVDGKTVKQKYHTENGWYVEFKK